MRNLSIGLLVVSALAVSTLQAQDPPATVKEGSSSNWQSGYQQESPRDYVRRRAQERSAARQARIEGMKWLGHSPSRPVLSATPFMSSPPSWVGIQPTGYWWGWPRPNQLP